MKPLLLLLLLVAFTGYAQTHRFEPEIKKFEEADKQTPPPTNAVVFTGSSSIRFWDNLSDYFPGKTVLQRGFGGAKLSDVRYYADRVIVRYQPKQVILYAGENDVAAGVSARETYARFVDLFRYVRKQLPKAHFTFISLKPSPSRRKFRPVVEETNRHIRRFLSRRRNADFVDIVPVMLQPNGEPIGDLFKVDSLHMTKKGYERWGEVLRPFVK
ncbi:MAG: GDSL-type esterase/lipase family protein [Rudanella sp.]|nr:GDSL-type esterase/lipase family protein [Rudanella sp.]